MKDKDEVTYGSFQSSISRRNFLTRAVTLGLSLSTVGISLQACSNNDTIESSLSFANWASAETATRNNIDKALQAFENQNSVQVNNIGIPFDQVLDQLTQAIRANITMMLWS